MHVRKIREITSDNTLHMIKVLKEWQLKTLRETVGEPPEVVQSVPYCSRHYRGQSSSGSRRTAKAGELPESFYFAADIHVYRTNKSVSITESVFALVKLVLVVAISRDRSRK